MSSRSGKPLQLTVHHGRNSNAVNQDYVSSIASNFLSISVKIFPETETLIGHSRLGHTYPSEIA